MSGKSAGRIFNVRDVAFGSSSALEREFARNVEDAPTYVQDLNHLFKPKGPYTNLELFVRSLERIRRLTASAGPQDMRKLIGRDDH